MNMYMTRTMKRCSLGSPSLFPVQSVLAERTELQQWSFLNNLLHSLLQLKKRGLSTVSTFSVQEAK